ncbi:MAG: TolC family protein [Acidobacteriota bacterium]|nr:MAG: TolC family protein [Acidobacteriota bacterium]
MVNENPLPRWFLVLLTVSALSSTALFGETGVVRIGVLFDGPSQRNPISQEVFENEIRTVLGDEQTVEFPAAFQLTGNWTREGLKAPAQKLLTSPEIDFVLALGILAAHEFIETPNLQKPVFAPFAPYLEGGKIPSKVRTPDPSDPYGEPYRVSGVPNLNYLELGLDLKDDLTVFREIVPFSQLSVILMKPVAEAMPELAGTLPGILGLTPEERISILAATDSAAATLAALPGDAEAVYVTPLLHWDDPQYNLLIEGLRDRKLPSFAADGRTLVERGLMASVATEDDLIRRARRIAVNMQEVLDGVDAGEMLTSFKRERALLINMETAAAVGVSPRFTTLISAELVGAAGTQPQRRLSLSSVVREASVTNLDLASADRDVAAGIESVREARSPLLPQIGLSGDLTYRDPDLAELLPGVGETRYGADIVGSQLIYSDRAWANYGIAKNLQDARVGEREQLRLDTILDAANAYLTLLNAKTIERIQKDNLALTRLNLDLARARVEIGTAGREELFRWESQIAQNQKAVVEAEALRAQAEIEVNRILNKRLDEPFETLEAGLNDPELNSSFDLLAPYVDSPAGFELYSRFQVDHAIQASPELTQLDAGILAKEREIKAARRSFFLPDIYFQGGFSAFDSHGRGTEPALPDRSELHNTWQLGVTAQLSLFEGGGRSARLGRARIELDSLNLQREALRQRVEQRMRSSLFRTNASFIGIELARRSAEAARKNLNLITQSYGEGVVGILGLIDAQNQALVADLTAASAVYTYLIDFMGVQRASGRFDYYRSPAERQEFLSLLNAFYRDSGFQLRRR